MSVLVVDASHWQEDIDPAALKAAGVIGVIHKCTEIMRYKAPVDEFYEANKARCLAAGLLWGSYLYIDPTDGTQQADFYLETVKPDGRTLLSIDVEESGITLKQVEDSVTRIHDKVGVFPWLYSSYVVLQRIGGLHSAILAQCLLWLAGKPPTLPPVWANYTMWQFDYLEASGKEYDLNIFNGTFNDLSKVWKMASPDLTGTQQAALVDTPDIPGFTTPGGEVHSWHKPGEVFTFIPSSVQAVKGVNYLEGPDDIWFAAFNIPSITPAPIPPPPPPPVAKQMVTMSVLNMRQQPMITSPVLVQIPQNTTITVTGTPSTALYHYVSATAVVSGRTFSGFVSADFLKNL